MLLVISMEVRLKVYNGKITHVIMSHEQNTDQNHNIKTINKTSESVTKLKYLGNTPTNQNCMHEEVNS